jgi:hypothetical protein
MEKDPEQKIRKGTKILKYSGMTFQIAAYIGVGVFIGKNIDEKIGFEVPYMTALFSILFLVAGLYVTLKDLFKS